MLQCLVTLCLWINKVNQNSDLFFLIWKNETPLRKLNLNGSFLIKIAEIIIVFGAVYEVLNHVVTNIRAKKCPKMSQTELCIDFLCLKVPFIYSIFDQHNLKITKGFWNLDRKERIMSFIRYNPYTLVVTSTNMKLFLNPFMNDKYIYRRSAFIIWIYIEKLSSGGCCDLDLEGRIFYIKTPHTRPLRVCYYSYSLFEQIA